MKIAYLLSWPLEFRGGVEKKIETQVRAWKSEGHDVAVHVVCGESGDSSALELEHVFLHRKRGGGGILGKGKAADRAFYDAAQAIRKGGVELVYYRLSYPTPSVVELAKSTPTIVEVNNNNFREIERNFGQQPIRRLFMMAYLKRFYPRITNVAAGFVGVTNELLEMAYIRGGRAKRICIPNSINLRDFEVMPNRKIQAESLPRVAFLGGAEHPEGIRRILELAEATLGRLEFSVFGQNFSGDVPANVKVYGFLKPEDYIPRLAECDVGLSTLTFYQKGLRQAASLKVREYLARGLPVILAHEDAAFPKTPDFILRIPDQADNVETHADEVVEFAKRIRGRRVGHDEVRQFIDSKHWESLRLEFFDLCAKRVHD